MMVSANEQRQLFVIGLHVPPESPSPLRYDILWTMREMLGSGRQMIQFGTG